MLLIKRRTSSAIGVDARQRNERNARMRTWESMRKHEEDMRTLEKPDSFASELFLDRLNLLESRKQVL
jgi:hypothetical protein